MRVGTGAGTIVGSRQQWLLVFCLLGLLVSFCGAQNQRQDPTTAPEIGKDAVVDDDTNSIDDACAPLYAAQAILKELQPSLNAHLERKIGVSLTSTGWGDGLGWSHEGPLSTTFRLLPKLLTKLSSPFQAVSRVFNSFLSSSPKARRGARISKNRRTKIDTMLGLMDIAEERGCEGVWSARARVAMFPPKDMQQDLPKAYRSYERSLETTSDPEAQFMIGLFHATGIGGIEEDQGKALLYYTFAALQGFKPAQMALGYRYWAGIGVKEECLTALDYYEDAAEQAYSYHASGPAGGRSLPLTLTRLSDRVGGIYGPHASWASTGGNAYRTAVKASSASARGETENEILEYYQYHSDRDSHSYTVQLGKLFYLGSVYPLSGGIASGAEGVGEIPQSFTKAREYFVKVARILWPVDVDANGNVAQKRKMSKENEEIIKDPAMIAASYLGRMFLRGEGMKKDYKRARMWYERAMELGDREAHNGLGIMYRDGLGLTVDKQKAFHLFSAAAGQDLAEAQVNLGKLHLEKGEIKAAISLFEVAIRHGSPLEAFHLLSRIHATSARLPAHAGGAPGMCGVSVAWFKLVSERGSWQDSYIADADKAWARGEEDRAMIGWMIGAEMGSEVAQNNIAFLLDQGKGVGLWRSSGSEGDVELVAERRDLKARAMRWWIRSAAQDNVDAMVKVGDLYYTDTGNDMTVPHPEYDHYELAASYYQTAADTQTSAIAYWNLGWMYEQGQGVPRDWHLAKRYYDMSGETSQEAWPAVMLSLAGLYLRSWWIEFKTRGEISGLRFFEPEEGSTIPLPGLFTRLKNLILSSSWFPPISLMDLDGYELDDSGELYDDVSGSGWSQGGGAGAGAGAEEGDWDEDIAETVVILGIAVGVMALVWLRGMWVRWEEDRVRREEERRRREQGG